MSKNVHELIVQELIIIIAPALLQWELGFVCVAIKINLILNFKFHLHETWPNR